MQIKQKKWNNFVILDFEADHFIYHNKDESGGKKRRFSYLDLPARDEFYEVTDKNVLFLIGAMTFLVVGLAQYFIFMVWKDETRISMASISLVCYALFKLTETQYTVIPTNKDIIRIIKDRSHSTILDELYTRRNKIIKDIYAKVDLKNDINEELEKFRLLHKDGIISDQEYAEARLKITSYDSDMNTYGNETVQ